MLQVVFMDFDFIYTNLFCSNVFRVVFTWKRSISSVHSNGIYDEEIPSQKYVRRYLLLRMFYR